MDYFYLSFIFLSFMIFFPLRTYFFGEWEAYSREELVCFLFGSEIALGSLFLMFLRQWTLLALFCLGGFGLAVIGEFHKRIREKEESGKEGSLFSLVPLRDLLYLPLIGFFGLSFGGLPVLFVAFPGEFLLIDMLVNVYLLVFVLLLYVREFELTTHFSLVVGVLLILVAIFLPVIPPRDFIDYPAIVFGIGVVALSLISTQLDKKKKEKALLLIVLLAPVILIFTSLV